MNIKLTKEQIQLIKNFLSEANVYTTDDNIEAEKYFKDAQVLGVGIMKGGQHIPVKDFYKSFTANNLLTCRRR